MDTGTTTAAAAGLIHSPPFFSFPPAAQPRDKVRSYGSGSGARAAAAANRRDREDRGSLMSPVKKLWSLRFSLFVAFWKRGGERLLQTQKGRGVLQRALPKKEGGEEGKIIRIRDGIGRVLLLPQPTPLQSKHDGKRDRKNSTEEEGLLLLVGITGFLLGNTAFLESSTGRGGRIGWGLETRTWMRRRRRRENEREKMGVGVPFPSSSSFPPLSPPRKNKYSEACRSTQWGCIHSSSSVTTTIPK